MKKLIYFLLTISLFALCGCGGESYGDGYSYGSGYDDYNNSDNGHSGDNDNNSNGGNNNGNSDDDYIDDYYTYSIYTYFPESDIHKYYYVHLTEPDGNFLGYGSGYGYRRNGIMSLAWSNVSAYDYNMYIQELINNIPYTAEGPLNFSDADGHYFIYNGPLGEHCEIEFIRARELYYEDENIVYNQATLTLYCSLY